MKRSEIHSIRKLIRDEGGIEFAEGEIQRLSNEAKDDLNIFPEKNLKVIKKNNLKHKYVNKLVRIQKPDISKIQKLGWNPTFSVKNGFRRTIVSFLEN